MTEQTLHVFFFPYLLNKGANLAVSLEKRKRLVQGQGVFYAEIAAAGTDEAGKVRAGAQGLAQVTGYYSND